MRHLAIDRHLTNISEESAEDRDFLKKARKQGKKPGQGRAGRLLGKKKTNGPQKMEKRRRPGSGLTGAAHSRTSSWAGRENMMQWEKIEKEGRKGLAIETRIW